MDEMWGSADRALGGLWLLFAACSLAVWLVPGLRSIGDHGKQTLISPAEEETSSGLGAWFGMLKRLMVPKQLFAVLYLYGFVVAVTVQVVVRINPYPSIFTAWEHRGLALTLWAMHLLRRLLECVYITNYGRSEMHIFGFIVGIAHYTMVPVSLFCVNSKDTALSATGRSLILFIAVLFFVLANFYQFKFHFILYRLKATCLSRGGQPYALPEESCFKLVSCPHYTAEIAIYMSLCLMAAPAMSAAMSALLLWVVSNLSVVADRQHLFYSTMYPDKVPKKWHRLFPLIY